MDGISKGDPLGGDQPVAPEQPGYGGGPVPPGAFTPRERPQRLPVDVVFADWWRRVVAAILDGIITFGAAAVILSVLGVGLFSDGDVGVGDVIVTLFVGAVLFVTLGLLYAPLLMARTNGQTLGKMALGIRVVRVNGAPTDFWWSALRELVVKGLLFGVVGGVVTGGIAAIVDWLWPLFDSEERALHDYLVDSRVVRG